MRTPNSLNKTLFPILLPSCLGSRELKHGKIQKLGFLIETARYQPVTKNNSQGVQVLTKFQQAREGVQIAPGVIDFKFGGCCRGLD